MRRLIFSIGTAALVLGFLQTPAASAQQAVDFYVGAFQPHRLDARGTNDVLFQNGNYLDFNLRDFDSVTGGGDYLIALGDYFDVAGGVGIYSKSVPAVYTNFVNSDGSEIVTDLKLRIVPITATVRWLPFGHHAPIVPYVGGGVGVFAWRYSEAGQFVDFTDNSIFQNAYVASGAAVGPVALGGVQIPIGPVAAGFEARYQSATGDLPANLGFSGTQIDLGGWNYLFIVNVRF